MNRTVTWSAAAATVWLSAAALAGCGAAAAPAEAPSSVSPAPVASPEPGSPATAEDALAALERAESELQHALDGLALQRDASAGPRAEAPLLAPPAPAEEAAPLPPPAPAGGSRSAPAPRPHDGADRAPLRKELAAEETSADRCETACRALASMERAAQHLCGLAGDADPRCEGARTRVTGAASRVAAQCPRCAGHDPH